MIGLKSDGVSPGTSVEPARVAFLLLCGAYLVLTLFATYLVWFHLNVFQIDAAGHVASAAELRAGRFHWFNDLSFLGFVNNLAYPPLEDALIAGLSFLTGGRMLPAYQLYLSLMVALYLFAIVWFSSVLQSYRARAVFLLLFLAFVNLEKGSAIFQGLALADIFVTGLTAEVLGFSFYLLLLRELLTKGRISRIATWGGCALLSHLVIGPFALLTIMIFALIQRRVATALGGGLAFLAGGMTLLPLLAHRSNLCPSKIVLDPPEFLLLSLLMFTVLFRRVRKLLPIPLIGIVLLLPGMIAHLGGTLGTRLIPIFHYNRLNILSLALLIVSSSMALSHWRFLSREKSLAIVAIGTAVIFGGMHFRIVYYPLEAEALEAVGNPENIRDLASPGRRAFAITKGRPCDFYIGSSAAWNGIDTPFVKGLYWEVSRSNQVLSSYLGTLLDERNIVLDFSYWSGLTCSEMKGIWDNFIDDYAIETLVVEDGFEADYLSRPRRRCLRSMIRNGTKYNEFQLTKTISFGDHVLEQYEIHPRDYLSSRQWIEILDPEDLESVEDGATAYLKAMWRIVESAKENRIDSTVFVDHDVLEELRHSLRGVGAKKGTASLTRTASGEYQIDVRADSSVLFAVKLDLSPGMELINAHGEQVPLYRGLGRSLAVGKGRFTLRYRRPLTVWIGYVLSLVGVAGVLAAARSEAVTVRTGRRRRDLGAPSGGQLEQAN